jgi:hypothetical protein
VITYCTNIHPGESWEDTFNNLQMHIPAIKTAVSPQSPFPIGLRLSHLAATELDTAASAAFVEWLHRNNAYVPTINGFPYGSFHAGRIKEHVYLPDWRQPERSVYTKKLADLLDSWLPADLCGSISTVPVGFRSCITDRDLEAVRLNLIVVLEHLDRLRQASGKMIVLSLEPEPGCYLESTEDLISFFERMKLPAELSRGLGICFDCCHHAVGFETPAHSLTRLAVAGITIGKVQVSSAPRLINPGGEVLQALCEPTYLHQVVICDTDGGITRYNDLPDALRGHHGRVGDEWRIHFHLPIFLENTPWCETTAPFVEEILPLLGPDTLLEIETYTWDVLPPEMQMESVTHSIIHEFEWLKARRS